MSKAPSSNPETGERGGGATEATSLTARVFSGAVLVMGGFAGGQIIRLFSNLVLARLVVPEAFGLMAVAVSVYVWAMMLTDIGVNTSIVRSRHADEPDYLRTAWTMQIVRNAIVWILTILGAIGISLAARGGLFDQETIFSNPALPAVMIFAGMQILIAGFVSVNSFLAERRLAMKRVVALEISVQIAALIITLSLASAGLGVWALVIGGNMSALFQAVASHFVFPGPKMGIRIERKHFDEIFHFGKWLILASFFGFLLQRGDQLLFGGFMEGERFSLYAVAAIWKMAAVTVFATLISRIVFPAFSEIIRERPERLGDVYRRMRLIVDAGAVGVAFGAYFLAEFVFGFIYPEAYEGVGQFLRLMSPVFLMMPFRLLSMAALAAGDSKGYTWVTGVAGAALLILVPVSFHLWGETGAVIAYACAPLMTCPFAWRLASKYMPVDPWAEARMLGATALLILLLLN